MKTKKVRRAYRQTSVMRVLEVLAHGGSLNCYEAYDLDVFSLRSAICGLRDPRRYGLKVNESIETVQRRSGNTRVVRYILDSEFHERAKQMLRYKKLPRFVRINVQEADQ